MPNAGCDLHFTRELLAQFLIRKGSFWNHFKRSIAAQIVIERFPQPAPDPFPGLNRGSGLIVENTVPA
jgi:hypothetical protein